MRLTASNIHYDGPLATSWDAVLRIVGDFDIYIAQKLLYTEEEFCVVEFALQLATWIGQVGTDGPDFVYNSMESEVEGLVRFTRVGVDQWRVSAAHQEYVEARTFTTEEVRGAALDFTRELRAAVKDRLELLDHVKDERAVAAVLAWRP